MNARREFLGTVFVVAYFYLGTTMGYHFEDTSDAKVRPIYKHALVWDTLTWPLAVWQRWQVCGTFKRWSCYQVDEAERCSRLTGGCEPLLPVKPISPYGKQIGKGVRVVPERSDALDKIFSPVGVVPDNFAHPDAKE